MKGCKFVVERKFIFNFVFRIIIWGYFSLFLYDIIKVYIQPVDIKVSKLTPGRVAHAVGGVNNDIYTNSYQALDNNIKKGFTYFEIDFVFTSDNEIVCLHDWNDSFYSNFGYLPSDRLSLEQFVKSVELSGKYKNCTLHGLSIWMMNNPSAILITDVKGSNIDALKKIHSVIPDSNKRVIPQIYNPNEFSEVKEVGFESIIWTLYKFNGSNRAVLYWLSRYDGKVGVTMPKHRATSGLSSKLNQYDITSFVHTVNNREELIELQSKYDVTEVYTDFISPQF